MFRYLNYLIIALITGGISASYVNLINHNTLCTMDNHLKIQYEENKKLKEEIKETPKTIDDALERMYASTVFLLKQVNTMDIDDLDIDVVDEIKLSCTQILETLTPKSPLKLEVVSDESFEDVDSIH